MAQSLLLSDEGPTFGYMISNPGKRAANTVRLRHTSSFLISASADLCYDPSQGRTWKLPLDFYKCELRVGPFQLENQFTPPECPPSFILQLLAKCWASSTAVFHSGHTSPVRLSHCEILTERQKEYHLFSDSVFATAWSRDHRNVES
jgi:hypothetical protein